MGAESESHQTAPTLADPRRRRTCSPDMRETAAFRSIAEVDLTV